MVIWEIFGISVSSGQIKTHSFRLLQWVAQYQDLPSLKRYENLGFGAIWVRVGIRRNRRRNAHRTRAFVQCAEMQMSSLQHGEGCDCAAVKSCPGCQSWIIPRKGKASISRRGGGRGLHYGKTRRPGPLFHSSGESWKTPCISNEWFYVSVLRGPTSISWIQANILCLTDCDFHSRVHRWLLQGYEGIMSVFICFFVTCAF